jgi:hypothetical protein
MKNFILNAQFISLCILGFLTLCILGAEPGTSESSMYEYEHFCDKGNLGWYMCWGWVAMVVLFLTLTAIRYYKGIRE